MSIFDFVILPFLTLDALCELLTFFHMFPFLSSFTQGAVSDLDVTLASWWLFRSFVSPLARISDVVSQLLPVNADGLSVLVARLLVMFGLCGLSASLGFHRPISLM